jgi:hypothetical protein
MFCVDCSANFTNILIYEAHMVTVHGQNSSVNHSKHKEAFSALVKCLYKWHTFISQIFLKLGWIAVSAE